MAIFFNIFIGVLSGILTSALLYLGVVILNKIIIPWYQTRIYRGLDIEGNWKATKEEHPSKYEFHLRIKQAGHKISGKYLAKNIYPHKEAYSDYTFIGFIKDNYILIQYETSNNKTIGLGAFLLQISNGGDSLVGPLLFMDRNQTDVHSLESIQFIREK